VITQLTINFPRIVEVRPAKREAVVDQQMAIENIQRVEGRREALAEGLAQDKIDSSVCRQVIRRGLTVVKSRAVINVTERAIFHGSDVSKPMFRVLR